MERKHIILPFVFMVLLASCSNGDQKTEETKNETANQIITESRHSTAFNQSLANLMNAYYNIKDALVEADTSAANKASVTLVTAADSLKADELKADTIVYKTIVNFMGNIAAEAKGLAGENDITEKRRSFSMITENLYPLLQTIKYDQQMVYHQYCPMAFNDDETAYWLSNTSEVINPYLGKKHPKYAAGMLHCGDTQDSLGVRR